MLRKIKCNKNFAVILKDVLIQPVVKYFSETDSKVIQVFVKLRKAFGLKLFLEGFELLARQCHLSNSKRIEDFENYSNGLPHGTTCQLSCMSGSRFSPDDPKQES